MGGKLVENDEAEDHPQDSEGSAGAGEPTTAAGTKEVTAPAKKTSSAPTTR